MKRSLCSVALAAAAALLGPAALAAQFAYVPVGDVLLRIADRDDVDVAIASPRSAPTAWRRVFSLDSGGVGRGAAVGQPTCDDQPTTPFCFLQVVQPGSDRSTWQPIDLSSAGSSGWIAIEDFPGTVEDVDVQSGLTLLIAGRSVTPKPEDLAPGLYLLRRGEATGGAQLLKTLDPTCVNRARFARAVGSDAIVLFEGCGAPSGSPQWISLAASGRQLAVSPALGTPIAVSHGDILVASASAATQEQTSLWRVSVPTQPNERWTARTVYRPAGAASAPAIHLFGRGPLSLTAAVLSDERVIAVATDSGSPALVSFCSSLHGPSGFTTARTGGAEITVTGGDTGVVVTQWDLWGDVSQYFVTDRIDIAHPVDCTKASVSNVLLPPGDRSSSHSSPLVIDRRSARADDAESVPYVVLGKSLTDGPVLVRVYGAFNASVPNRVTVPIERRWVEAGGRLVVATVRGDEKEPPWMNDPASDYKARAARDTIAVVEDLVARHSVVAGEVTILGGSEGGFTAARAALSRPDLFSAAVLISGTLDLRNLASHSFGDDVEIGPATGSFGEWYAGVPSTGGCRAVRFFIYNGASDARVDPQNAYGFAGYLKSLGYRGVLKVFPNVGHELSESDPAAEVMLSDLSEWNHERSACPA